MSFSLAGSLITQSGTDTDLSGLSGISGVTTTTLGGVVFYDVGAKALNFSGTQTINGRTERVISSFSPGNYVFQVSGTMTINDFEDKSGDIEYYEDVVFHSTYVNSFCCGNYGFRVSSSGTLVMNGGYIRSDSSPLFETGSRLESTNAGFISNTSNNTVQLRFFCNDFDVNGFFVKNFKFVVGINALASSSMNGLELYGGSIATSGALSAGSEYVFKDFGSAGYGSEQQVDINDNNFLTFINPVEGSEMKLRGVINDARASGLYKCERTLKVKIEDDSGVTEGASIFVRDTNNNERRNWTASGSENDTVGINFIEDKTYFESTQANGETPEFNILLSVLARPTGSVLDVVNSGLNTPDVRNTTGVGGEDIFNFNIWSYNHKYKEIAVNLKGAGVLDIANKVFEDTSVTQKTLTIVQSYTTINSTEMLYDYLKYMKILAANIELPTIAEPLLGTNGTTLTLPTGYALVRDQAITNPIEIDGTNIKVKTGVSGLLKTAKFDTLSGTIDSSFNGNTDMLYVKSNGKVDITIDVTADTGITSTVWGIWLQSQGLLNRTGILTANADESIEVDPDEELYFVIDGVNAYRAEPVAFTVGEYGSILTSSLKRIVKADGTNIIPSSLTTEQQRIADMMNFNQTDARVDIELPTDYATDSRWDSTNNIWTFESNDFIPLAYKAEQIQSAQGMLIDPSTVRVEDFAFVINTASTLTFRQHTSNVDCVINMNNFTIRRENDDRQLNTFIDHSNGVITVNAKNPLVATVNVPDGLEVASNITKINNVEVTDINDFKDAMSESELHTALNNYTNKDDWKADVSSIPTNTLLTTDTRLNNLDSTISSRSTFNPLTDTVERVTLVDTTTTNTDMRGTDGANRIAPNNSQFTTTDRTKLNSLENAELTNIATKTDLGTVNNNVKDASLLIPASRDL